MKDFSLLYGPMRTWLPILAMAALALVVFMNQSSGSETGCATATVADCDEPLLGERQLLGNGGGLDGPPAATSIEAEPEPGPSPWDRFVPSDDEVPFVSLRPSPEPMTEAGQDLVRSADPDGDDDENGAGDRSDRAGQRGP